MRVRRLSPAGRRTDAGGKCSRLPLPTHVRALFPTHPPPPSIDARVSDLPGGRRGMGNEPQRRVLRNTALFKVPVVLLGLTASVLVWSVVRVNVPASAGDSWPWKLELLDVQSATTATTVTAGLIFARAQYASAVRPMIGWVGYVVEVSELSEPLAWTVRLVNGAGAAAQIHDPMYRVVLRGDRQRGARVAASRWMSRDEAVSVLGGAGARGGLLAAGARAVLSALQLQSEARDTRPLHPSGHGRDRGPPDPGGCHGPGRGHASTGRSLPRGSRSGSRVPESGLTPGRPSRRSVTTRSGAHRGASRDTASEHETV